MDDVNMLRVLLEQERSAVAIDLKDVLLVDREAIKLLANQTEPKSETARRTSVSGLRGKEKQSNER
jgi:hypothetical protein